MARILLALGLALAVVPLVPGVARAEGEVPANVAYATNPQSGVGQPVLEPLPMVEGRAEQGGHTLR